MAILASSSSNPIWLEQLYISQDSAWPSAALWDDSKMAMFSWYPTRTPSNAAEHAELTMRKTHAVPGKWSANGGFSRIYVSLLGSKPSTPSTLRAFALWKNMESVPWYLSWLTNQWEKNTYIHSAPIGSSNLPFYCFDQKMWTLRRGVSSLKSIGQPWFLGSMPSNSSLLPWVGHRWRIQRRGRPARNSSDVFRFGEQWSVGHIQSAARNFWLNPHT